MTLSWRLISISTASSGLLEHFKWAAIRWILLYAETIEKRDVVTGARRGGGPWQPFPNRTRGEFRSSWPELNEVSRTRASKGTARGQVVLIISPSLLPFLLTIYYWLASYWLSLSDRFLSTYPFYHRKVCDLSYSCFPCFAGLPRFVICFLLRSTLTITTLPAAASSSSSDPYEFCSGVSLNLPSFLRKPIDCLLILTFVWSDYSVPFHRFIIPPWRRFAALRVTTSVTRTPS